MIAAMMYLFLLLSWALVQKMKAKAICERFERQRSIVKDAHRDASHLLSTLNTFVGDGTKEHPH